MTHNLTSALIGKKVQIAPAFTGWPTYGVVERWFTGGNGQPCAVVRYVRSDGTVSPYSTNMTLDSVTVTE